MKHYLQIWPLCACVVSCAVAAVPESVAGYALHVDFSRAQSCVADLHQQPGSLWGEVPMTALQLVFPASGQNAYSAAHPHNDAQTRWPDIAVSYAAAPAENKAYVQLRNPDFEALVVLLFADAASGTATAMLSEDGTTTHYRNLSFRLDKAERGTAFIGMPQPGAEAASDARWEAELDDFIAELNAANVKSATDKLYRKRLQTLLPLIRQTRDASITTPETKGNTALHYACALSHVQLVQWLIDHGADLEARTNKGATVDACISGKHAKQIRQMLLGARAARDSKAALAVTDEPAASSAAAWLEAAFTCRDVDSVHAVIPDPDEEALHAAETVFHFVQSQQRLPQGVQEHSRVGQLLMLALKAQLSAEQFKTQLLRELKQERERKLDSLMEAASVFADAQLCIPDIADDVTEIVVMFDPTGHAAPEAYVARRKVKRTMAPYTLNLHFCGRVSTQYGAEASVLLGAEFARVAIAEPDAHFDADMARHFGKHCRLVSYLYQSRSLDLYYTPDGEIDASRTPARQVPQSPLVFPIRFRVTPR